MGAKMTKRRKVVVCDGGIYRRIIIFVLDILRKQGFTMFPLKSFYLSVVRFKNRSDAAGGCPQSFCFFFEYLFSLLQRKKYQCILYYIIILIAVFSKSLSRQFVKNSISIALFSKARYLRHKKWRETMLPPLDNYSVPASLTIKEFSHILLGY